MASGDFVQTRPLRGRVVLVEVIADRTHQVGDGSEGAATDELNAVEGLPQIAAKKVACLSVGARDEDEAALTRDKPQKKYAARTEQVEAIS
jgi:hypothetical protein